VELGDIIVGIDGQNVANNDDLYRILEKHQVGDTVQVQILRNGRRASVPVRLTGPSPNRLRRGQ